MLIVCLFLILALILATPMGILYKLSYRGHERHGLKPFCTPYESEHFHLQRKEDGNRSDFSKNWLTQTVRLMPYPSTKILVS